MKKKVLIAYNAMNIGGSTTSLLSILNLINYDKYEIDLLLNQNEGPLFDTIPSGVKVLSPARIYMNKRREYLHRIISPRFMYHYFISKRIIRKTGIAIQGAQYREWKDIDFQREISDEYDVAIAFLEGDRCKYVARHVKAKRKIAWIHINYIDAQMNPIYDRDTMNQYDAIVLVSGDCKQAFDTCFPELSNRSVVIENILSTAHVRRMSEQFTGLKVNQGKINLVTTCRVSFRKGLDRAVIAFTRLKEEKLADNYEWYIIGDGGDFATLQSMIVDAGLSNAIHLLGRKSNPFPYLKGMSLFFLPSKWEGKPMAVTEGFMMGLPALVTDYSSAREQVEDGVDGFIMENSCEGIYQGLRYVLQKKYLIAIWRENVLNREYSNIEEMQRVEAIIDGQ